MGYDTQFYGVSPSGLAYGGLRPEYFNESLSYPSNRPLTEAYGGHVMYNQEFSILPLVSYDNFQFSFSFAYILNAKLFFPMI